MKRQYETKFGRGGGEKRERGIQRVVRKGKREGKCRSTVTMRYERIARETHKRWWKKKNELLRGRISYSEEPSGSQMMSASAKQVKHRSEM